MAAQIRQSFIKGTNIPKYRQVGEIVEKYCETHKEFHGPKREDLIKACHYSNLQPLWAKENWSKGGVNRKGGGF